MAESNMETSGGSLANLDLAKDFWSSLIRCKWGPRRTRRSKEGVNGAGAGAGLIYSPTVQFLLRDGTVAVIEIEIAFPWKTTRDE
jgi:hypothetical protein